MVAPVFFHLNPRAVCQCEMGHFQSVITITKRRNLNELSCFDEFRVKHDAPKSRTMVEAGFRISEVRGVATARGNFRFGEVRPLYSGLISPAAILILSPLNFLTMKPSKRSLYVRL